MKQFNLAISIFLAGSFASFSAFAECEFENPLPDGIVPTTWCEINDGLGSVTNGKDVEDELMGFANQQGKIIIPLKYIQVFNFNEGLANVTVKVKGEEKEGYINTQGKMVIPPIYDAADKFYEGLAEVSINGKTAFIDKAGKAVVPFGTYDNGGFFGFNNGLQEVTKNIANVGERKSYINTQGKLVFPLKYSDVRPFTHGLGAVQIPFDDKSPFAGKYGFIDRQGNTKIDFIYDSAFWFDENGLAGVSKNGKAGFIDTQGKTIIPFIYDEPSMFFDGLARVSKDGKYGAINTQNKAVIPLIYDQLGNFKAGLALVAKNNKFGFVNRDGKVVIPLKYDDAEDFKDGYALVKQGNKEFFIDTDGKRYQE